MRDHAFVGATSITDAPPSILKEKNSVSENNAGKCSNLEVSKSDYDSSASCSSASDKNTMVVSEPIHNIPDKSNPFANKHLWLSSQNQLVLPHLLMTN